MSLREMGARWAFYRLFRDVATANRLAVVALAYWSGEIAG